MELYMRCGVTESWNHSMVWVESSLKTHLDPKLEFHPLNHIIQVPRPSWLSPVRAPHDLAGAGLGSGILEGTLGVPVLLLLPELLRVWQGWRAAGRGELSGRGERSGSAALQGMSRISHFAL